MDTITGFTFNQPGIQSANVSSVAGTARPSASSDMNVEEVEQVAASQVLFSESVNISNSTEQRMVEKYEAAVDSVGADKPMGLADLPPLKMFNEADVKEYEKQLMSELASRGIDISQPMNLGFDFEGNVVVQNDHPDKAAIEATFKDDMDLRNGLVQTTNHYLFKEMYALHQQWAEKINSGVPEEVANVWLINTVQDAVNKSSQGITLSEQGFQDPFNSNKANSVAMNAYQL